MANKEKAQGAATTQRISRARSYSKSQPSTWTRSMIYLPMGVLVGVLVTVL